MGMRRAGVLSTALLGIVAIVSIGGAASARTPPCGANSLSLSVTHEGAGLGHQFYSVVLRNRSKRACKLAGYPGVSLLDSRRRQIDGSARRSGQGSHRFTVQPGQAGKARFTVPTSECGPGRPVPKSTFIQVIPPDTRTRLVVRLRATACSPAVEALRKSRG
jgi:hypothetical protein